MAIKIRKGSLVEVVRGHSSDEKKLAERGVRRTAEGLEPLEPDDEGKQGRVIRVFSAESAVLVEDVNFKTHHVRQDQNQADSIETVETPILLAKITLVDPDTKQRARVGFREDVVERDDRARKVRVCVTRGDVARGIKQGKEI